MADTDETGERAGRRSGPGGGLLMGRPFGVPVYVSPSWFLVAALITWVFGDQLDRVLPDLGPVRYLVSLFFAVAFYASVLVHELAHTVAALRFKLPVRRIQLQFFGGVSEIEKESETPGREFVLAFVGPLLSLLLTGAFYLGMKAVDPATVPGVLLAGLMISNLLVAAFNLLPGSPSTAAACSAPSSGASPANRWPAPSPPPGSAAASPSPSSSASPSSPTPEYSATAPRKSAA